MKQRPPQQAPRWLEVIHLRASEADVAAIVTTLREGLAGRYDGSSIVGVRLLRSPTVTSDLLVHIQHVAPQAQGPAAALGQGVIELLEPRGLVRRTLWIEIAKEEAHGNDA